MTALIVAPELELCLVERRGFFTVPTSSWAVSCDCPKHWGCSRSGDGRWSCGNHGCAGVAPNAISIEHRSFQLHVFAMGKRFIERQDAREYHAPRMDELILHGPFPSYGLNDRAVDVNSSIWRDAMRPDGNGDEHPELSLSAVFERQLEGNQESDYLLVGKFLKRAVLTEIIIKDVN